MSRPNGRRLGTIVVGIAVLGLVGFFYFDSRDAQRQLSSQVQQNADLQKQLENLVETVSEIKTSKLYRQEEQTIARDDSLSAMQLGKPADSRPRINEIEKQATEKLAAVGQALGNLTAIAKQAAAFPPNQDHSLESAIADLEDSRAKDQRARVTEAVTAARRESDEKLARASAESERKIADAKAQAEKLVGEETATKIVADAKRQQQQLAQERKKKDDEAREAALEKEYEKDLPQIRQYLSAFITHGFAHRDKRAPKGPIQKWGRGKLARPTQPSHWSPTRTTGDSAARHTAKSTRRG